MITVPRDVAVSRTGRQLKSFPSAIDALNFIARIGSARPHSGIRYGHSQRHVLDVYRPQSSGLSPVIVFFYGGGWEEGERSRYFFVGSALAAQGFTTVIPDYRLYPEVCFPGFVEDAAAVIRWTSNHIADFGGDRRRVIAMGHSAGAHIAALLAFDRKWLARVNLDTRVDISAMIGLAGPYDFLPLRTQALKRIFGPEKDLPATQPINFVDAGAVPTLLATGKHDRIVEPGNTLRLAERIRAVGGEVEVRLYDRVGHRTLIGAFSKPLRFLAPVLNDVVDFALRQTDRQKRLERAVAQGCCA
jgi:acetyl esterase/lipase